MPRARAAVLLVQLLRQKQHTLYAQLKLEQHRVLPQLLLLL